MNSRKKDTAMGELKRKYLIFLSVYFIMFMTFNVSVEAQTTLSAWTDTPPTIDGILTEGEWNSANTVTFTITGKPATIYVMNDANNLYILLKIGPDSDNDTYDTCGVYFDNDNGGGIILEHGDDAIQISVEGFVDLYWDETVFFNNIKSDGDENQEGSGMGYQDAENVWYFEFSHPLDSQDDEHDFNLGIGDTVGFAVSYADWDEVDIDLDFWPGAWNVPDTYAKIKIANIPPAAIFGFDPITFYALIGVLVIAVFSSVIFIRRWRKQKTVPSIKYCKNCGAQLSPEASFCQKCGKKIK